MVQLSLALTQKISLSQMQRLMIQLMTLRGQDMRDFLQEQVVTNPLLDIRYPDVYRQKGKAKRSRSTKSKLIVTLGKKSS